MAMAEKRYSTQKYVWCTCKKHQEILVGMKIYSYKNIILIPMFISFFVLIASAITAAWYMPFILIVMILLGIFVPISIYTGARKDMLNAGHSIECARQIGRLAVFYAGSHSSFKILDKDEAK